MVYILTFILVLSIIMIPYKIKENRAKRKREIEAKIQREKEEAYYHNLKIRNYDRIKGDFIKKNGVPDKSIILEENNLKAEILIYEMSKEVRLCQNTNKKDTASFLCC